MKFRTTINIRTSGKSAISRTTTTANHLCSDCKITLVRQQMEFVCPNCGMVEEFIEGSE